MKRVIIFLADHLHEQLRREAFRLRQSTASLIRSRLEKVLFRFSAPPLMKNSTEADPLFNAWKLRLRYKDKPKVSFTDLTRFVVMRENHIRRVVTADAHFGQIGLGFQILP
ncbi:MAG TPA: hypothetical protein VNV82_01755 [Bryobacteraceae bacterium]|nr:hypothetical protein [Bryobacteraceae bacterium]